MTGYDAVVYDLDGTLVDLDVDWTAVATDVRSIYRRDGLEPPEERSWAILREAGTPERRAEIDATIAEHERAGARTASALDLASVVVEEPVPVGVCSLNCEAACRIALERHGLAKAVDAVVGRDSVPTMKPDPEPLLAAIDRLPGESANPLFVGDSESDATTAERAGVAFRPIESHLETGRPETG
ncbi:HAD family hydrolase [Halovivax limisalsi]|uniref:HAD family hydrolase n=1 Tax=Halovivax limisalsi TaxID=1453760 RepID=UPI001FFCA1CA|nr:HAD-IA family hydrolase [Halovivax limisalsi]